MSSSKYVTNEDDLRQQRRRRHRPQLPLTLSLRLRRPQPPHQMDLHLQIPWTPNSLIPLGLLPMMMFDSQTITSTNLG